MSLTKRASIPVVLGLTVSAAHAAPVTTSETVVHDTTSIVELALDDHTVLCSAADYGALFLKVGIPELAHITLLDHQNIGAGAPCVAAGRCEPGHMPSDIIDPARPTELVDIHVKAVRVDVADAAAQTCATRLIERVNLTIRGTEFTHERSAQLGSRPFADCATATANDGKADGDDPGEEPSEPSAGCATTSTSSLALSLLALGMVIARRRR